MGFSSADAFIVVAYLVAIAVFGIYSGGKQSSVHDYFLGGKNIPWWAVCFSVVATETSTLTFISIPGLAYLTNLNFLQVTFGYLIGRIIVSFVFLPAYARGELETAYAFLEHRFGTKARRTASATFMGTRLVADGVRLFATAIPLAVLLKGWGSLPTSANEEIYVIAIVVMAAVTLLYTFIGGVRAVIWTDVVQMFIYLGGAAAAIGVILSGLPGNLGDLLEPVSGKLSVFNLSFDKPMSEFFSSPYTLMAGLGGGAFLSMASHGTDQLIVQRLLTVRSLRDRQKALIGSGAIVIIQFALFLFIGVLLYVYYGGASLEQLGVVKADEVFPKFIIERIPSGLSGLIIAGLLAAAMSTLSGSVNSLASAVMLDFYKPRVGDRSSPRKYLALSRTISAVWAVLLVGVAVFFIYSGSKVLVEIALGVASFTYGGLLGMFLLGAMTKKISEGDAILGFACGITAMIAVVIFSKVGWTWYTAIGSAAAITAGWISYRLRGRLAGSKRNQVSGF
jgi:SSS family transporter